MERVNEGMHVYSLDGEKLGKVTRCEAGGFEIEKGFFFPKEYWANYDDVARIEADKAYLRYGRDTLRERSEAYPTRETTATTTAPTASPSTDTRFGGMAGKREELRVPVAEEQLDVTKHVRETGEVRVHKEVRTEMKQVNVPVSREEVHVERVPVETRSAGTDEARFESGTLRVPIREEEIEITKRPVIREEVRVSKQTVEEQKPVTETIRREEVEVDEDDEATRRTDTGAGIHAGADKKDKF